MSTRRLRALINTSLCRGFGGKGEIRRLILVEGHSKRSVCRRFGIHWDTLVKILEHVEPPYRQSKPRSKRKIGPYIGIIEEILRQDRNVHRKRRHTKRRIFDRLRDEYGYPGGATAVKEVIRDFEQRHREVFMPLVHRPGEAQVDFGSAEIIHHGQLVDEDPTGSLDTPMTNSPTIRRGLQLAWSRREGGEILPNHLVAVCLMCWRDEQPAGIVDRDEVRDFVSKMGTTHLPGFAPVMSTSPTINETTPIRIPSVEDLATLVGPAPTADDLIDLYLECEREADPVRKARLKLRLDYLTHRG